GDLREKSLAVDEAPIGVGVEEVGREVGIKPGDIGLLNGSDEVPVELLQLGAVLFAVGHGTTPWANAPPVRSDDLAKAIGKNPDSGTRICGPETQNGPVS